MKSLFSRRTSRVLLVAVSAATTAACSDFASEIARPIPTGLARSVSPSGNQFVVMPNSRKYSDAGSRPWRGKSNKGQGVWSRALINRDGTVTLEVATSEFESAIATVGELDKVQVKSESPDGTRNTVNFNDVTGNHGYLALNLGYVARNTIARVQVNVDDALGRQNDVVVAEDTVKFRPDLRVFPLDVSPRVRVDMPFDVGATVSEIKGDVGARADCVLYADGREVDRIVNMWVDARSSVACAFRAPAFTALGSHTLRIAAERVAPADYDLSSNSATTSVEAVIDHIDLGYDVAIWQLVGHSKSAHSTFYVGTSGTAYKTQLDVDSDHDEQLANFSAWANQPVRPIAGSGLDALGDAQTAATVSFSEATDGVAIDTVAYPPIRLHLNYGTVDGYGGGCFWSGRLADGFVLRLCTYWNVAGVGQTYISYTRFANQVLYVSKSYQDAYDPASGALITPGTPYYLYTSAMTGRPFHAYGTSVAFNFFLDAGNFTLSAKPQVALTTAPYNSDRPRLCSNPYLVAGGTQYECDQFLDSGFLTTGGVSTGDPNASTP